MALTLNPRKSNARRSIYGAGEDAVLTRRWLRQVQDHLKDSPAVALLGPRQVGKTTLALEIAKARGSGAVYLDLERPADLRRLAEADWVFERGGRVEMAIEVKRSSAPDIPRGFRAALTVLQPQQAFVVHGGVDTWGAGDGITATSLLSPMETQAGCGPFDRLPIAVATFPIRRIRESSALDARGRSRRRTPQPVQADAFPYIEASRRDASATAVRSWGGAITSQSGPYFRMSISSSSVHR